MNVETNKPNNSFLNVLVKTDHVSNSDATVTPPNIPNQQVHSSINDESENYNFINQYIYKDSQHIFNQYSHSTNQVASIKQKIKVLSLDALTVSDIGNAFDESTCATKSIINNISILSRHGWDKGAHEFSFKIEKCDIYRQEIGVVSIDCIQTLKMNAKGIRNTESFRARAVYGHCHKSNSSYYASYNKDGTIRCYKDLTNKDNIKWCQDDIIRICVDIDTCRIKFYVNDIKIRKTLSLEKSHTYYPIISFGGECRYQLIDFK